MLFQHKRLLNSNDLILVRLTSLTSLNLTKYNILIHIHLYNNSEVEVKKKLKIKNILGIVIIAFNFVLLYCTNEISTDSEQPITK